MTIPERCDKCNGKIIDKHCLCGYWFEREDMFVINDPT